MLLASLARVNFRRYCPISLQTLMNKRSLDDREILDVCFILIIPIISHPSSHPSTLQILCSTSEALVHLHTQTPPIAHRDIKVPPARLSLSSAVFRLHSIAWHAILIHEFTVLLS